MGAHTSILDPFPLRQAPLLVPCSLFLLDLNGGGGSGRLNLHLHCRLNRRPFSLSLQRVAIPAQLAAIPPASPILSSSKNSGPLMTLHTIHAFNLQTHRPSQTKPLIYWVTTINMSRKWIEWAGWAALSCTANSPFPGHVYCRHSVVFFTHCPLIFQGFRLCPL